MEWSSIVNMKFVVDWCVFAYPDNAQPPPVQAACSDVCAGPDDSVKLSLNNRIYEANQTLQYLYCDGPNILDNFDDCIDCLNKAPDAQVLTQCTFRTHSMILMDVLTEENLVVKTLKAACVQKPAVGQTVKLDFDLFPTATTAAASQSATAAVSKASSDNKRRTDIGVGVGVGVGGFLAILILVCVIWRCRRSRSRRQAAEENTGAYSETKHQANPISQNQSMDRQRSELDNHSNVVEVGGQSHKPFMLDSDPIWEVPGDTQQPRR